MKRLIALIASPLISSAQTRVGVSIGIGQPGYYGQLEIGNVAPPPLMYAQPMIIQPAPVGVIYPPLYLRVPSGHYRNWRHYCGRYNACGRPVYFVQDNWYRNTYAPRYRNEHNGHGRDEHRRDDRRDERR
jgi:hypothetical protein